MKQTFLIFSLVFISKLSFAQFEVKFPDSQTSKSAQQAQEYRVTAYYKSSYSLNDEWKSMSIKVKVITNSFGKDELTVVAYKSIYTDEWINSTSSVSNTYGNMKDYYRYRAYVASNEVYFNL